MKREQFNNKHRNLQLSQAEMDRKWNQLCEHEERRIFESMYQQAVAAGLAGGGANGGAAYMPGDYMIDSNNYVD
jgi:hypothetical protein